MMIDPLVSIIMPVYNAEEYLALAVNSVIRQSYSHWELLIVNDGSTDASEKIILEFSDVRIIYLFQENKGVGAARNLGLQLMKGNYFCFLDSDDLLTENSLSNRIQLFEKDNSIDFVDGTVELFDDKTKAIINQFTPSFRGNPLDELTHLSDKCFFGITWMIRRRRGRIYQFKEGITHCEDLLFYIKISQTGMYDFVDSTIYKCRIGNHSAMSNLKNLEDGYFMLLEEIKKMKIDSYNPMKKVKSIMFKSYLSKFRIFKAIKVLMR